jgi:predicted hotdog family 3-hydroxylacyl-ACP dehydratase
MTRKDEDLQAIDFDQYLPQRRPMRMLSEVLDHDDRQIRCRCHIEANNPLLKDGLFPVTGGLELLAQSSGLLLGLAQHVPERGVAGIVQLKTFQVQAVDIPVTADCIVQARLLGGGVDAAQFEGEVYYNEQQFFAGTLMLAQLPGETT